MPHEVAHGLHPAAETGLELSLLGHGDIHLCQRRERVEAARDAHHAVCTLKKLLYLAPEERVYDGSAAMQSDDYLGDVTFLHGIEHPGDEIEVIALYGSQGDLDSSGGTLGHVERVTRNRARWR